MDTTLVDAATVAGSDKPRAAFMASLELGSFVLCRRVPRLRGRRFDVLYGSQEKALKALAKEKVHWLMRESSDVGRA